MLQATAERLFGATNAFYFSLQISSNREQPCQPAWLHSFGSTIKAVRSFAGCHHRALVGSLVYVKAAAAAA